MTGTRGPRESPPASAQRPRLRHRARASPGTACSVERVMVEPFRWSTQALRTANRAPTVRSACETFTRVGRSPQGSRGSIERRARRQGIEARRAG